MIFLPDFIGFDNLLMCDAKSFAGDGERCEWENQASAVLKRGGVSEKRRRGRKNTALSL